MGRLPLDIRLPNKFDPSFLPLFSKNTAEVQVMVVWQDLSELLYVLFQLFCLLYVKFLAYRVSDTISRSLSGICIKHSGGSKGYPEQTQLRKRRLPQNLKKQSLWYVFDFTIQFAKYVFCYIFTGSISEQEEMFFSQGPKHQFKDLEIRKISYLITIWNTQHLCCMFTWRKRLRKGGRV